MTANQKVAYRYLQAIGSSDEFKPVNFFLMVQETALTIQQCSLVLDELEEMRLIAVKDTKSLTLFKLRVPSV